MRIKTQFTMTMLLFGIVLVAVAATVIIVNRRVEKADGQERRARNIAQEASELSYLSNDYLIYRESQQRDRWQSKFNSFSNQVAKLKVYGSKQQALVHNIRANQQRLKEVFDSTVSAVGNPSPNQKATLNSPLFKISWSRMEVQSQELVSDALRLSQLLRAESDRLRQIRNTLIYFMLGIFGAFLLVNYIQAFRRALRSIARLQAGTAIIGSGNLDFKIEEKRNDEIGDLSHAFNRMTANLKDVTASKSELVKEIGERKRMEEQLRQAEEKSRLLIKYAPSMIYEVDFLRPAFKSVNDAMCQFLGYTREELLAMSPFDLLDEEGKALFQERIKRKLAGESISDSVEYKSRTKDGREVYGVLNITFTYKDGKPEGAVVVAHDITDRKRAEEALRENEKWLVADLEAMKRLQKIGTLFVREGNLESVLGEIVEAAIAISGADFGNIQLLDPKSSDLHIAAQRGFPTWWLDFWNNVAKGQGCCGTALERGERVIVEDVEQSPIFVGTPALEIQLKAGVRAVQSTPLVSRSGNPLGMFSTHYKTPHRPDDRALGLLDLLARQAADLIEYAKAEEALREAYERTVWLARFPEQNPNPIIRVSADGTVLYCNPVTTKLRGWNCEVGQVLPKELFPLVSRAMTGGSLQEDVELNGRVYIIWVEPFPGEGYANIYGRDITDRKRTEEALRQSEERLRLAEAIKAERHRLFDVLETLPAMICLLTPDYHVVFANRSFREKFGESGSRHCYEYCFGLTAPCDFCETYKVLETGKPHHWEVTVPDGTSVIDAYDFPFTDVDGSPLILEMDIDITERKQAEEALRKARDQVRFFASQCLTAQERERRLIAGEIHDSMGASLAATKFKMEDAIKEMGEGNPRARAALESVIPVIQGTIEEARRIQMALRPSMLDDLGILATINWFCRQFESTYSHIHIRQEIHIEEREVPDSLRTVIYRLLQEAMNNIAKHSKGDSVNLRLRKMDGVIELGIIDNGQGFDLEEASSRKGIARGLGLDSMRERAELSGGSFSIESSKGAGTVIRATWPIEQLSS